jgi:enoyl-CoA hydratase
MHMVLSEYRTFLFERRARLLYASFKRPDGLNAIGNIAHEEVARFFTELATDSDTDVLILSGVERALSAAAGLEQAPEVIDDRKFLAQMPDVKRIVFSMLECPKPIIAKLNGSVVGLSATIVLLCDVIFAAPTAKIGGPQGKGGFTADGGAVIWPHLVGPARAKEYLMTGRLLTAQEAEDTGLINHVVPAAELDRTVDEFAQELLGGAMRAIQWTKLSVNNGLKQLAHAVMDASVAYETLSNATLERQEAIHAKGEKRTSQLRSK